MAEAELRRLMQTTRPARRTDAVTFADAATEYLRFVGEVRRIDYKTLSDYRGVINGYLLDEFGELELGAITPDLLDAYKEHWFYAHVRSSEAGAMSTSQVIDRMKRVGWVRRTGRSRLKATHPSDPKPVADPVQLLPGP